MKSNKGITLVALVITIIVLLILAGVSISLVVGDNGIMTRAKTAAEKTNEADALSAVQLAVSSLTSEFYATKYTGNVADLGTSTTAAAYVQANLPGELTKAGYTGTLNEAKTEVTVKKTGATSDSNNVIITLTVTGEEITGVAVKKATT